MIEIRSISGAVLYTAQNATDIREALQEAVKARANLADANLAGANLAGADLAGANFAGANLARANLARANLARANFAGANLEGANLEGANLEGANLEGANLEGAEKIAAASSGSFLGYSYLLLVTEKRTLLRYGCEQHELAEWPSKLADLCQKHVGGDAKYVACLRALVAFGEVWAAAIGGAQP